MRSWDEIVEAGRAFMLSRVVLSAVELDLFTVLGSDSRTAGEIAGALKADSRAVEILLDALTAQGLLVKQGNHYSNTNVTREYLDTASPTYRGGTLRHAANLWDSWSYLTEVARTGKPHPRPRDEASGRAFILAMHHGGWEAAQLLARELDLSGAKRMLDLGGGPGSYAIAFCERNPGLKAVVYDLPYALEVAREVVAEHGLSDRIELVAGDFLKDPVPGGFDLVLVSNIVHSYGAKDSRRILLMAADALAQGGGLAVQDFLLEPDRTRPAWAAMFAINMLVGTAEGRSYTADEVAEWMTEAGIGEIRRIDPGGPGSTLLGVKG